MPSDASAILPGPNRGGAGAGPAVRRAAADGWGDIQVIRAAAEFVRLRTSEQTEDYDRAASDGAPRKGKASFEILERLAHQQIAGDE